MVRRETSKIKAALFPSLNSLLPRTALSRADRAKRSRSAAKAAATATVARASITDALSVFEPVKGPSDLREREGSAHDVYKWAVAFSNGFLCILRHSYSTAAATYSIPTGDRELFYGNV